MYFFRANGSKVKFPAFMKVYMGGNSDNKKEEDRLLPDLEAKEKEPKQHFTQPPPRYTETRLVKTLEELGIDQCIGTRNHTARGYIALDVLTELGEIIHEVMVEYGGIFPGNHRCRIYSGIRKRVRPY